MASSSLDVATFYKDYFKEIVDLKKNTFPGLNQENSDLRNAFKLENVHFETLNGNLTGYIYYFYLYEDVRLRMSVDGSLKDSRNKGKFIPDRNFPIELFDNEFTRGKFMANPFDMYISSISVDKNYRGQGFGKKLMSHAVSQANKKGSSAIYLNCWGGSEYAEAFYLSLGFQPILRVSKFYEDKNPTLFMGLIL